MKKKKVNILKNYNINVKNPKLFDEYSSVDLGKNFKQDENKPEKATGQFGMQLKASGESKKESKNLNENSNNNNYKDKNNPNPYSDYKDDYANKFIETDNSDINFLSENLNSQSTKNEHKKLAKTSITGKKLLKKDSNDIDSIGDYSEDEHDPGLEKLKKSLDSYTKNNQHLNKFSTLGVTPRSGVDTGRFTNKDNNLNSNNNNNNLNLEASEKEALKSQNANKNSNKEKNTFKENPKNNFNNKKEESDMTDFLTNKDQTTINKNDVSETVNVYERIYKDFKKDSKSEKDINATDKDIVNYNFDTKSLVSEKDLPPNLNINNIHSNSKKSERNAFDRAIPSKAPYEDKYSSKLQDKIQNEQRGNINRLCNDNKQAQIKVANSSDNSSNVNSKNIVNQGETVIFLNNLDIEKSDFKDLNNFFSPQSRLEELQAQEKNQRVITINNQSHLSSFNNHLSQTSNNTPSNGNNNNIQHNINFNNKDSNKNIFSFDTQKNKQEEINSKDNKLSNFNTKISKNSLDELSQANLNEYFDSKLKRISDDVISSQSEEKNYKVKGSQKDIKDNSGAPANLEKQAFSAATDSAVNSGKNNIDLLLNESENNILSNKIENKNSGNKNIISASLEKKSLKELNEDKLKKLHNILDYGDEDTYGLNNNKSNLMSSHNNNNNKINLNKYFNEEEFSVDKFKYDTNLINNTNTAEILNMALELKEAKKTISSMKDIIDELRKESKAKEEFFKKQIEEKLKVQKFEFDKIIDRQKEIIENLLNEKKKLSAQVQELTEKTDASEKHGQKKVSQMLENFELELKKNKDAWFQAEKIRRKKWEDLKIKEIKEITVKGLEPEFERIINRHKHEIQLIEDKAIEDQRKIREKLSEEFERRLQEAKERFLKEKEEALEHERTLASQRILNQNERLEEEYSEERKRWTSNIQAEVQRLEKLRENDKKIYEDQITSIEQRNLKLLEEKENFYKLKISEMEKRFDDKIQSEQNDLLLKFAKEKERFIEEKAKEFEHKFKDAKHELIKDRDKQLQLVIDKLGDEALNEKKKMLIECEAKADIINKQLRQENDIMSKKIQELSDKLGAESKVRFMLDESLESLSKKLQDKDIILTKKEKEIYEIKANYNEISEKYSRIAKEFSKEKIDIEHEFSSKLMKIENDMKLLVEKNEVQKAHYESMQKETQKIHQEEIDGIEEKIKKALSRKDDVIKKFQEDLQVKELSIHKLEELLAKQRKELLMNNNL